jgi:hypothetical protein
MSSDKVTRAMYVTRPDLLARHDPSYTLLYFGNEVCERLLPTARELDAALRFAGEHRIAFTLVTPYVTDAGLAKVADLLKRLARVDPQGEVVFNDWGVLRLLRATFPTLRPLLGRLLTKMKRGPRLVHTLGVGSPETSEYLRSCSLETPHYQKFLQASGVMRVELDNVLQGIDLNLKGSELRASLYWPYAFVTTTRLCLAAGCNDPAMAEEVGVLNCRRECRHYTFMLHHPVMPTPLHAKGNSKFVRNDELPGDLVARGIDRIVCQPEIPV